eukprot:scaffold117543_cov75-Cyclotella_meneghiniana.AAC.1
MGPAGGRLSSTTLLQRLKTFFVLAKPERSLLMVVSLLKMVRQRLQLVHSRLASSRADNT